MNLKGQIREQGNNIELWMNRKNLWIGSKGIMQISSRISELQSLKILKLDLTYNNINYQDINGLALEISKLQQLNYLELRLAHNHLGNSGIKQINETIRLLGSLRTLVLILDNNDCDKIVWNWNCCKCLEDLTVSQTNVAYSTNLNEDKNVYQDYHESPMDKHPLLQESPLKRLNLIFSGSYLDKILPFKLPHLFFLNLDLRRNQINPATFKNLFYAIFKQLPSLISLDFLSEGNRILEEPSNLKNQIGNDRSESNNNMLDQISSLKDSQNYNLYFINEFQFPNSLQNLSLNLQEFNPFNNNSSNNWCFTNKIHSLKDLTTLSVCLPRSHINSYITQQLLVEISQLYKLTHLVLDLSENPIGKEILHLINPSLSQLNQLSSLKLKIQNTSITVRSISSFSFVINNNNHNTVHSSFSQSPITLTDGIYEFFMLPNILCLTYLHLNLNSLSLSSVFIDNLSQGISKMTKIRQLILQLQSNSLYDKEVNSLSKGIQKLNLLHSLTLNLNNNQIGDQLLYDSQFLEALLDNYILSFININLASNQITKVPANMFRSQCLRKLKKMVQLNLICM